MAKKNPAIDIKLLEALTATVKEIGVQNTSKLLRDATDPIQNIVNMLINDVCLEYSISRKILYDTKTRGRRVQALASLIFLMCKYFDMPYKQVYYYIPVPVDVNRISQYIHYVSNLDSKLKCDNEIILKNKCIEEKLIINIKQAKGLSISINQI